MARSAPAAPGRTTPPCVALRHAAASRIASSRVESRRVESSRVESSCVELCRVVSSCVVHWRMPLHLLPGNTMPPAAPVDRRALMSAQSRGARRTRSGNRWRAHVNWSESPANSRQRFGWFQCYECDSADILEHQPAPETRAVPLRSMCHHPRYQAFGTPTGACSEDDAGVRPIKILGTADRWSDLRGSYFRVRMQSSAKAGPPNRPLPNLIGRTCGSHPKNP
jgi:hypothetical protein